MTTFAGTLIPGSSVSFTPTTTNTPLHPTPPPPRGPDPPCFSGPLPSRLFVSGRDPHRQSQRGRPNTAPSCFVCSQPLRMHRRAVSAAKQVKEDETGWTPGLHTETFKPYTGWTMGPNKSSNMCRSEQEQALVILQRFHFATHTTHY